MDGVAFRMAMSIALVCSCFVAPAEAQLNTQHIKGTVGLKSGSQAPSASISSHRCTTFTRLTR